MNQVQRRLWIPGAVDNSQGSHQQTEMDMNYSLKTALMTIAATLTYYPQCSNAYLGGFELEDGYGKTGQVFLAPAEVAKYNAGQYGTNNGGPGNGAMLIPDNSGLWTGISGTRHPNTSPITGSTAYATAHQNYDRVAHNTQAQALVMTTNVDGWSGQTLEYDYRLDPRDLNGLDPMQTAGRIVRLTFWWCAQIFGFGDGGGLGAGTIGDTVKFLDNSGNVGFTLGLIQPGNSTDYVGWDTGSGFHADPQMIAGSFSRYSKWDVLFNLTNQTVSASYQDGEGGTIYSLLNDVGLAAPMSNFTHLRIASTPGINNEKRLALDDFNFSVSQIPEPPTILLVILSMLFTLAAKPRSKSHLN